MASNMDTSNLEEEIVVHENDAYESFNSDRLFYHSIAQHKDLRPSHAEFVAMCEETPHSATKKHSKGHGQRLNWQ
jgi:hypothetical protein